MTVSSHHPSLLCSANVQTRDIHPVSLTENMDTATSTGQLIFHLFAYLAEFEHNLIRERVEAGLQAARGRVGGRKVTVTPHQI